MSTVVERVLNKRRPARGWRIQQSKDGGYRTVGHLNAPDLNESPGHAVSRFVKICSLYEARTLRAVAT